MGLSIELKNVTIEYKNNILFNNVNLYINKPGLYFIEGDNGCGKTTLFNSILGLKEIKNGYINIKNNENEISAIDSISYVSQDVLLIDNLTVIESFKLISNDLNYMNSLIELFDITRILNLKIKKCSMGEKQRIQIVMALLKNKPIMLLDEAFSHIDINMTKIILEYLSNMKDKIILLTIHNRSDVLKNCTNIITIKDKMINYESKNDEHLIQLLNKNEYVNKKILKKIMFPNLLLFFKIIIIFISALTAFFINISANSTIDNTVKFYNNQTDIKYKYNMIRNKEIFNMDVSDYEEKLLKNPFFRIPEEILDLNEIEELKKNNPNYKNIYYGKCMNIYFEYKNISTESIFKFYYLIDESIEDDLIITDTTTKDLFKETELNGYVFNVLGKDIGYDYFFRKIILNFKTFINLEFHSYMCTQFLSNKDLYNYKIIEGKDVSNDNEVIITKDYFDEIKKDYEFHGLNFSLGDKLNVHGIECVVCGIYDNLDIKYKNYLYTYDRGEELFFSYTFALSNEKTAYELCKMHLEDSFVKMLYIDSKYINSRDIELVKDYNMCFSPDKFELNNHLEETFYDNNLIFKNLRNISALLMLLTSMCYVFLSNKILEKNNRFIQYENINSSILKKINIFRLLEELSIGLIVSLIIYILCINKLIDNINNDLSRYCASIDIRTICYSFHFWIIIMVIVVLLEIGLKKYVNRRKIIC